MKRTVWYIFKPGDERSYATPTPPAELWGIALRKEGFRVIEVTFEVPSHLMVRPDATVTGTSVATSGVQLHCDVCGEPISDAHEAKLFWGAGLDQVIIDWKIAHKQTCDTRRWDLRWDYSRELDMILLTQAHLESVFKSYIWHPKEADDLLGRIRADPRCAWT